MISGGVLWPEPWAGVFGNASRNLHFFIILVIIFSSFWPSFGLGSSEICREFLGIPSEIHKNDEKMKKKRRFLVGFFGQSPRLEFLGMLRGILIFPSFWSSFFHHFGLRLVHHFLGSSEIWREFPGIPSKIHKNDEKMKKKRGFLVGFFGQSPRLEFLGMLRGIFIFSSFWSSFFQKKKLPSFGPSFLGSSEICREFQMMKKRRLLPRMMKPMKNKW